MAADYWRSSQANHWLLSPYELKLSRLEDIRYAGSEERVAAVTIWMANAISQLAKRFGLRQRVTATATVLFHRFYAVPPNAYCNTDPCMVATACLYVASKVEETPLHVRSVVVEAARAWTEYGHSSFPTSGTGLAEMEFYLLRDLDYHLVLYHPYRPLMAIVGVAGKTALEKSEAEAKSRAAVGATPSSRGQSGLGSQADLLGVGSSKLGQPNFDMASLNQAEMGYDKSPKDGGVISEEQEKARAEEEMARKAMTAGDYGLPVARAEEIDDGVVQMAWFLLNDTYRHASLHLLYPPYILALASLYLALVLHETSRDKMLASVKRMEERRRLRAEELKQRESMNEQQAKKLRTEDPIGGKPSSASTSPSKALPSNPTSLSSRAGLGTSSNPSSLTQGLNSSSRLQHALPPRPGHLPPRPGASLSREPSNASNANGRNPPSTSPYSGRASPGANFSNASPRSPPPTDPSGSAASATSSLYDEAGPTPPPDVLTFLASLNLSPTHQLASCIQAMLDGYAVWGKVIKEIDGVEGSKRVMGWLETWRKMREEELRVLDLEGEAS